MKKKIIIKQLPDIHNIPKEYQAYGRFGILQNNSLWFGNHLTSHPKVKIGYYWAIDENNLYISSRTSKEDINFLSKDIIIWLSKKIGIKL